MRRGVLTSAIAVASAIALLGGCRAPQPAAHRPASRAGGIGDWRPLRVALAEPEEGWWPVEVDELPAWLAAASFGLPGVPSDTFALDHFDAYDGLIPGLRVTPARQRIAEALLAELRATDAFAAVERADGPPRRPDLVVRATVRELRGEYTFHAYGLPFPFLPQMVLWLLGAPIGEVAVFGAIDLRVVDASGARLATEDLRVCERRVVGVYYDLSALVSPELIHRVVARLASAAVGTVHRALTRSRRR